jgi:hypothetical protein
MLDLKLRTAAQAIDSVMTDTNNLWSTLTDEEKRRGIEGILQGRIRAWLNGAPATVDSVQLLWRIFSAISVAEERHPTHYVQADYRDIAAIMALLPYLKQNMARPDLETFTAKYPIVGMDSIDDPLGLSKL